MQPLRRRPVDFAVSAAIVVVVVIAAVLTWHSSSARRTTLTPATVTPKALAYPADVPARLLHRWSAKSVATRSPQVTDTVVLTAHEGAVAAHDPRSGAVLWQYRRALPICALLAAWYPTTPSALVAYRNSRGCGEITAIDANRGVRRGTRSSDADATLDLQSDGGYVLGIGPARLETWGSNLVRGVEYGRIDARVKPDMGRRDGRGCRLKSGMTAGDRVALVEHCDGDPGFRLTVIGALLDKEEKIPSYGSTVITSGTAFAAPVVIAMSDTNIAVYDGGANSPEPIPPTVRVFNSDGAETGRYRVPGDAALPADSVPVAADGLASVWTGHDTVVLDGLSMRPVFTATGTRGPGVAIGARMLIPDDAGYLIVDAATGQRTGHLAVARETHDAAQAIVPAAIGDAVVEQRGDTLAVYGP
jgi:outer membrane protein assembly factor BamB